MNRAERRARKARLALHIRDCTRTDIHPPHDFWLTEGRLVWIRVCMWRCRGIPERVTPDDIIRRQQSEARPNRYPPDPQPSRPRGWL